MTRQVYDTLFVVFCFFYQYDLIMSNNFSDWLVKEMEIRNLTARKLDKLSGISHSHISKIVRGEVIVTWEMCDKLAKTFNLPVWKLFLLAELIEKVPDELLEDERIRTLVNSFYQLSEVGQLELLNYAAWLVHRHSK